MEKNQEFSVALYSVATYLMLIFGIKPIDIILTIIHLNPTKNL